MNLPRLSLHRKMEMQLKTKVNLLNSNMCVLRFWLMEVDKNTHAEKAKESLSQGGSAQQIAQDWQAVPGKADCRTWRLSSAKIFLSLRDILERKRNPRALELLSEPLEGTHTQSAKHMWPALPGCLCSQCTWGTWTQQALCRSPHNGVACGAGRRIKSLKIKPASTKYEHLLTFSLLSPCSGWQWQSSH